MMCLDCNLYTITLTGVYVYMLDMVIKIKEFLAH